MEKSQNSYFSFHDLWIIFFLPAFRPVIGINRLINLKRKLSYSTLIFLMLGVAYTVSVQLAYSKGLGAKVQPFIKIPADDYYYWQRFFQIPFFFITSVVFAGIARLLSAILKGQGKFEDLFCLFCVAQTLPMILTMWIPETILFIFFPDQSIHPLWLDAARQILGMLWLMFIMVLGISIIEKIKWLYSVLVMVLSAIPVTALMIIFIR